MIVVADTSVLLNLSRVEQIELLRRLFREIVIPLEVAEEFDRLSTTTHRFRGLTLPAWVRQQTPTLAGSLPPFPELHPGESAALALAIELRADAILIDERAGHNAALQLGLKTIGLLGILLKGKASGHLPAIRPVIERLEREAGFWFTPALRARVLQSGGE